MHLHFQSFLNADMVLVVEVFPHGRQRPDYFTQSVPPWLLMTWFLLSPRHWQPMYWPSYPGNLVEHLEPLLQISISWTNNVIMPWISNYIHIKQWNMITHQCPNHVLYCCWNFSMCAKSHPTKTVDIITYPCPNFSQTMLVKGAPEGLMMYNDIVLLY